MSAVVTSFKNDEYTSPPTLQKTVTITDLLIDQVHTFQNSYFQEHMWKVAMFYEKHICLRVCYKMCSWRNLSKSASIVAHQNI